MLVIHYKGTDRLVRPALHGWSARGDQLLLGAQDMGPDAHPEWRTFRMDRIELVELVEITVVQLEGPRYWH